MDDKSFAAYNAVINMLFRMADSYYGMSLDFASAGFDGFEAMARNESHERWHLGDKISKYLIQSGRKPEIIEAPAPKQNYDSPADAIKSALKMETVLVSAIKNGIVGIKDADPVEICQMSRYYKICSYEHSEINNINKKMAFTGATTAAVNDWLYQEYSGRD